MGHTYARDLRHMSGTAGFCRYACALADFVVQTTYHAGEALKLYAYAAIPINGQLYHVIQPHVRCNWVIAPRPMPARILK